MMGGLAYMTGPPGKPLRAGASIIDIGAATYSASSASLPRSIERDETGRGAAITSGLFETTCFRVGQCMAQLAVTGQPAGADARPHLRLGSL